MSRQLLLFLLLILSIPYLLASCGEEPKDAVLSKRGFRILATTDLLADLVKNVAGEDAVVNSLVPLGGNPHNYEPAPDDLVMAARADVIFAFGGGLEDAWMERLLKNAGGEALFVALAENQDEEEHPEMAVEEDRHHGRDPHIWMDPRRAMILVEKISRILVEEDPENAARYNRNSQKYLRELEELDAWIREQINQIPPEKRVIVTTHDFLGYYAKAYGLEIIGTALPVNPHGEPSAAEMVDLIQKIKSEEKKHKVPVLFAEEGLNPQILETVAKETGTRIVTTLLAGSFNKEVNSYIDFMRYDTRIISSALMNSSTLEPDKEKTP